MQSPPPFQDRSSGNKTLKVVLILIVFIVLPCAVGGYFVLNLARSGVKMASKSIWPTISCAWNFEQTRDALLAYSRDHDGKLPKAETWQTDVKPYYDKAAKTLPPTSTVLGEELSFKRFEGEVWACETGEGRKTGIAFNRKLSGAKVSDIQDPSKAVIVFETDKPANNASEDYAPRPNGESPRLFGEPRDWIVLYVEGKGPFSSGEFTKGSGIKIKADIDNVPAPETPEPPAQPK